ncbi:elongation of very long chain fatty acids protein 7-like [Danaus plexippus]|uniref:elongation of very long chain fatty acids protein 7-like n=1 Tax=Danaus plexippus TaxID=13037 RepID=UPI002AB064C8|nr:elongation of very long chain fatty acids protein 7-like [Danaus plexippus]
MANIVNKLIAAYKFVFEDIADSRTKEWFLVAKPYQPMVVVGLYLMFIFKWGPKIMKNRKPLKMDTIMIMYNAFQVFCCGYIFISGLYEAWGWKYKWVCEPVDQSRSRHAMKVATLVYMYYLLKILDLMDTVFFVLRHKFNQVSFLHVYHHTGMVILTWAATTYYPGGHGTAVGQINSFVHIVMYSYYLLTIAMPQIKNNLWWKKYITQLQILQFLLCVVHMTTIVFVKDCAYPRWISAMYIPQNLFMLLLFLDFYIKTYVKKPKEKSDDKFDSNETKLKDNDKEQNGRIQHIIRNNKNSKIELRSIHR